MVVLLNETFGEVLSVKVLFPTLKGVPEATKVIDFEPVFVKVPDAANVIPFCVVEIE
jgi:hypothetical protein